MIPYVVVISVSITACLTERSLLASCSAKTDCQKEKAQPVTRLDQSDKTTSAQL